MSSTVYKQVPQHLEPDMHRSTTPLPLNSRGGSMGTQSLSKWPIPNVKQWDGGREASQCLLLVQRIQAQCPAPLSSSSQAFATPAPRNPMAFSGISHSWLINTPLPRHKHLHTPTQTHEALGHPAGNLQTHIPNYSPLKAICLC